MPDDETDVAFVWVWLPGQTDPVVAGRLDDLDGITSFTYARSYLERGDAISLYDPELPLRAGRQTPALLPIHGCIADAGPDSWGRRVIDRRHAQRGAQDHDLRDITYLLESGSNRVGALDFQPSPDGYRPRNETSVPIDQLMRAAEEIDEGRPLSAALDLALIHGTSAGGAQPKATLIDGNRHLIAKFSSTADELPRVKLEYIAMTLAQAAALDVAPVSIRSVLGKDVLLVERFDRRTDGTRRALVSARTMLRLAEQGIGASYSDLADLIRAQFVAPEETLHELFARITFNILVGNTDDHARNHAAFWDGSALELTPAYDIEPKLRRGTEANQAMAIGPDGFRASQLVGCVAHASTYHLSTEGARAIIDRQVAIIEQQWDDACDAAGLTEADRAQHWERQFKNPYALEGY